jgi:hypothetical protein
MGLHETKMLLNNKEIVTRMKRQLTEWGKFLSASHLTGINTENILKN